MKKPTVSPRQATQDLMYGVYHNEPDRVARALALKANPNIRCYGDPVLHDAVTKGYVPIARLLLKAGADPSARADGRDVLEQIERAASAATLVMLLLDAGAKPRPQSLLHLAVKGFKSEARRLLEAGASLDGLLHQAAEYPSLTAVKILLELGADPSQKKGGKTALDVAKDADQAKIARYLASRTGQALEVSPEALAEKLGARVARWAIEGDDWDEAKRSKRDPWDLAGFDWYPRSERLVSQAIGAAGVKDKAERKKRLNSCFAVFLQAFEDEARRRGKRLTTRGSGGR